MKSGDGGVTGGGGPKKEPPQTHPPACPHGGQAESLKSLPWHIPGLGTSWVPSEGGMVKLDSQIGEFAP